MENPINVNQMSSMSSQIRDIGGGFQFIYMHFLHLLFYSQQNYNFRGAKSRSNMSSFEEASWPTFHWANQFKFDVYS